jgi:copper homeostasis protein
MPRLLLEVIVQSVPDALAATEGGADRLEVVRAIREGGLTPPMELVRAIKDATPLPLRVIVRENDGYTTSPREIETLQAATGMLAEIGVDGIVLGYARDGGPAQDDVTEVLKAAPGVHVTFHRAFDVLEDPFAAIDTLSTIRQIDRILTSGGDGPPAVRCERLRNYARRAGGRFEIVAGGAIDERCLVLLAGTRCVDEVHVGRAAREADDPDAPVTVSRVARLRELAG